MGVLTVGKVSFSEQDIQKAGSLQQQRQKKEITEDSMFCTAVYCILAIAERRTKLDTVYHGLQEGGFSSRHYFESNYLQFQDDMSTIRWPVKKFNYISDLSLWWADSKLPGKIMSDAKNGREKEFQLRNELADAAPGMGLKSASLFMVQLGYNNIVPVDLWESRLLKSMGHEIKVGDYVKVSGPHGKKYLEYEKIIATIAKRAKVAPAVLHIALLEKTAKKEHGNQQSVSKLLRAR